MDISNLTFDSVKWLQSEKHACNLKADKKYKLRLRDGETGPKPAVTFGPSDLSINTITVVYTVQCSEGKAVTLNLKSIHDYLVGFGNVKLPAKRVSKKIDKNVFEKKKSAKKKDSNEPFFNSITWKFVVRDCHPDGTNFFMNVSVKIFPNGKFQFAGFRNIKCCALVPNILKEFLMKHENTVTTDNHTLIEKTTTIEMINTSCSIFNKCNKYTIQQKKLTTVLISKYHFQNGGNVLSANYDPANYPGIIIKYLPDKYRSLYDPNDKKKKPQGQISLLLFGSGSVIITGGKDISMYKEVFNWIVGTVSMNSKDIIMNTPTWVKEKKKLKKPLDVQNFQDIFGNSPYEEVLSDFGLMYESIAH